jgi:hypothetical protein
LWYGEGHRVCEQFNTFPIYRHIISNVIHHPHLPYVNLTRRFLYSEAGVQFNKQFRILKFQKLYSTTKSRISYTDALQKTFPQLSTVLQRSADINSLDFRSECKLFKFQVVAATNTYYISGLQDYTQHSAFAPFYPLLSTILPSLIS